MIDNIDDRIVVFGQSCSGKTTFAKQLQEHFYYCFDSLFEWHLVEGLGVSIDANFFYVNQKCQGEKYVLDGWHLADKDGLFLPKDTRVYVIYCSYEQIIKQYRVEVKNREEYLLMYKRWYQDVDYLKLNARFIKNDGDFRETKYEEFYEVCSSFF